VRQGAGTGASGWPHYWKLVRGDRPIGTLLLLWPTWWALWLAAEGLPPLGTLLIFTAGVWLTRSAGCVINDYADRWLDPQVERTKDRPLATVRSPGARRWRCSPADAGSRSCWCCSPRTA
jgi:4-hydroxybenzoate polyprenyltransferase